MSGASTANPLIKDYTRTGDFDFDSQDVRVDLSFRFNNQKHLRSTKDWSEGYIQGSCYLGGTLYFWEAVRVTYASLGGHEIQVPDPHDFPSGTFDRMQAIYDGCYETVRIPGQEGEWVFVIYPSCR